MKTFRIPITGTWRGLIPILWLLLSLSLEAKELRVSLLEDASVLDETIGLLRQNGCSA